MTRTTPHEVLRASAGTGKTYSLTTRYLRLLHQGQPATSILATTFTRKAAGEILQRILRRLAEAATDKSKAQALAMAVGDPHVGSAQWAELLMTVCRQMHRLSVLTLDSFFSRLAFSFRLELGMPAAARVTEEDSAPAVRLRRGAIEAVLSEEDPRVMLDLLRRLHHDDAQRSVTDAVDAIVKDLAEVYQEAPDESLWRQYQYPPPLDRAALEAAIAEFEATQSLLPAHKTYCERWKKDLLALIEQDWDVVVTSPFAVRDIYCNKPVAPALRAAMRRLVEHGKSLVLHAEAERCLATFELLRQFDAQYRRLRDQQQVMLFADLPRRLVQYMQDGDALALSDIYYRLDQQIAHLMLDEFQDTSLMQWRVLEPMAQELAAHGDGERSFFCVGDVKQAIYGWRGGCAEIFDHIESALNLDSSVRHSLNTSYRSSPVVLDVVNQVFSALPALPALQDMTEVAKAWSQKYERHKAAFRDRPGYVELSTTRGGGEVVEERNDEAPAAEEAAMDAQASPHDREVAERIAALAAQAPDRSIGVLVSTNRGAAGLLALLRRRGVAASGEGGSPLTDSAAVQFCLAALWLADHPGDGPSALAVANSPLGTLLGLTDAARATAIDAAARIRRDLGRQGYGRTLATWAAALAPWCSGEQCLRLQQLVTLGHQYDPQATLRPGQFVDHVAATAVEQPSGARVRVMTVHKAKGLEFDIVVLPHLVRAIGRVSRGAVYVDRATPTSPIEAVYRATNEKVRKLDQRIATACEREQQQRATEDLCTLYVAMTRARHALYLLVPPPRLTPKGRISTSGISDSSYAAALRQALSELEEDETLEGGQMLFQRGDADWHQKAGAAAEGTGVALPMPRRAAVRLTRADREVGRMVSPSSLEAGGRVQVRDLLALSKPTGRLRGEILHALFELIEWIDDPATLPDEEARRRVIMKIAPDADPQWRQDVLAAFAAMLARPAVVAALRKPAAGVVELWRERAFVAPVGGDILRGRFDRVLVTRQSDRIVAAALLDYKTDRVQGDALAEAVARYTPQMRAYRSALSSLLALPPEGVSTTLLFVEADKAVTVE